MTAQPRQINGLHHPAKSSGRHVITAARGSGIPTDEIRKLLAGGKLGKAIPDSQIGDITKGIKLRRLSQLNISIDQCDRKLKTKGLPVEVFVAVQKAKVEMMRELSEVTKELDDVSRSSTSTGNGQLASHSFGPREQIGNVTAVQVNIGKAPEKAPTTDGHVPAIRT